LVKKKKIPKKINQRCRKGANYNFGDNGPRPNFLKKVKMGAFSGAFLHLHKPVPLTRKKN
jgi:hypothetical protein